MPVSSQNAATSTHGALNIKQTACLLSFVAALSLGMGAGNIQEQNRRDTLAEKHLPPLAQTMAAQDSDLQAFAVKALLLAARFHNPAPPEPDVMARYLGIDEPGKLTEQFIATMQDNAKNIHVVYDETLDKNIVVFLDVNVAAEKTVLRINPAMPERPLREGLAQAFKSIAQNRDNPAENPLPSALERSGNGTVPIGGPKKEGVKVREFG